MQKSINPTSDSSENMPEVPSQAEVIKEVEKVSGVSLTKILDTFQKVGEKVSGETGEFEEKVEKEVELADLGIHGLPEDMEGKEPIDLGYEGVPVESHQDLATFLVDKKIDLNAWNSLPEDERKKLLSEFEVSRLQELERERQDIVRKENQDVITQKQEVEAENKRLHGSSLGMINYLESVPGYYSADEIAEVMQGEGKSAEEISVTLKDKLGVEWQPTDVLSGDGEAKAELTDEQKENVQGVYEKAVEGSVDENEVQDKMRRNEITRTQGRLCLSVNEISEELSKSLESGKIKELFGHKVFEYFQSRADYSPFNPDEAGNLQDLLTRFDGLYKNEKGEYIGSYGQDSMNQNVGNLLEQLGYIVGQEMPEDVSSKYVELFRKGELENLPNMENIPEEISEYLQQLPEMTEEAGEDLKYAAEVLPKLTDGDMTVFDKLRAYKLWKKEEKWLDRAQEGMKGWYENVGGKSIPLVGEGLGQILESDKPKEVLYELEKTGLDEINKFGLQGVSDVIETLKNNGVGQEKIIEFFNNDQYRYLLDSISGESMSKDDIYNVGRMVENFQGLFRKENFDLTKSEGFIKENSEALLFLTGLMHNTPDVMERLKEQYFTGEDRDKWYEEWIKGRPIPG